MTLIYLACPYFSEFPVVEDGRYRLVTKVAAHLIVRTGCEVFSPITHSHFINRLAKLAEEGMWSPTGDFWINFDFHMLDIADWLYVLMLDGWKESKGIQMEIERFTQRIEDLGLKASYIKYIKLEDYLDEVVEI